MIRSLALTVLLALTVGQKPADPPYRKLKGLSFEPSAVVFNEQDGQIYVLNDKDPLIYSFKVSRDEKNNVTGLEDEASKLIGVISLPLPKDKGNFIPQKLEALAPWPGGGLVAATAFDRNNEAYNQIVKFAINPATDKKPPSVSEVQCFMTEPLRTVLASLPPASDGGIERRSFKIEGISPSPDGKKILVGVRRYYNYNFENKADQDIKEVVLIARFGVGVENPRELTYEGAVDLSINEDCPCPSMGLSDLQKDGDNYLILTSREDRISSTARPTTEGHAGALYRVPAARLEENLNKNKPSKALLGKPLRTFIAKPEGITGLGKGRYLVVFDDDSDGWKDLFQNYAPNEGLYEIVTLPGGPEAAPK